MPNDLIVIGWVFVGVVLLCLLVGYRHVCVKLPMVQQVLLLGAIMSITLALSIVTIGPKKSNEIQKVEIINPAPQHKGEKDANSSKQ